ncbi:hypothetical protein DEO72_LG2g2277 [Vigna unguiculata]|uniref:Uncharacterized protein n=1 Tax=Vigna unguiculata TaxID=3917 RepID=A0A4D6KZ46_VIGUN|nr:hypothetical protein DEO72_LG2g2277 [Vigna unguiculata]
MSFCSFVSSSLNRSRSCCLSLFTPKNPAVGPFPGARLSISPRTVAQATRCTFERANVSLRRGGSRLSENTCKVHMLEVELSPRRRELAKARVPLAWARPCSLSEVLGETGRGVIVFLTWLVNVWLEFKCCDESMREMSMHVRSKS